MYYMFLKPATAEAFIVFQYVHDLSGEFKGATCEIQIIRLQEKQI